MAAPETPFSDLPRWLASHRYGVGDEIRTGDDTVRRCTVADASGGVPVSDTTEPSWTAPTVGAPQPTDTDNNITWKYVGEVGKVPVDQLPGNLLSAVQPYASGDLTPGPAAIFVLDVADHATQNIDKVLAAGIDICRVDVIVNSTNGANANTIQLDSGTGGNHITDAISTNGKSAADLVGAGTIDPTYYSMAKGDTLRVIQTKAGGAHAFRLVIFGFLNGS